MNADLAGRSTAAGNGTWNRPRPFELGSCLTKMAVTILPTPRLMPVMLGAELEGQQGRLLIRADQRNGKLPGQSNA